MVDSQQLDHFDPETFNPTDTVMGYEFDRASGYVRAYHSESRDALGIKPYVPLSMETLDNDRVLYLHNRHDVCYSTGPFLIHTVAVFLRLSALRMRIYPIDEASAYYSLSVMDEQDRHRPAPDVSENDLQAWHLYSDPNGEDESILLAPKSFVAAIVAVSPDALAGERNHSSLGRNGGGL